MNFTINSELEQFIQQEIQSGKYQTPNQVIEAALHLLERRNDYDRWVEEIRENIDRAAAQLDQGEGIDGKTAISRIRERLYRGNKAR